MKIICNNLVMSVALINGCFGCLMAYQSLLQKWYYLTHRWEDKGVYTFPKSICPKVNVIARLEYELTYYDSAVHRFNHYTTRTPLEKKRKTGKKKRNKKERRKERKPVRKGKRKNILKFVKRNWKF